MTNEEIDVHSMGMILVIQYNMTKGIDLFGNRAEEAVIEELH